MLAEIKGGAEFEKIAKRESMDPQTRETGGDIGWARRGENVPEFDRWLFGSSFAAALQPGQMSPVVELHSATTSSASIACSRRGEGPPDRDHAEDRLARRCSSAEARPTASRSCGWAARHSTRSPKKYHDYAGKEETNILTPWVRDSLPVSYQKAFLLHKPQDVVTFQIPGSSQRPDVPKFVVAQLLTAEEAGERTLDEMRTAVRSELSQRGGIRRYIDTLKRQTYVAVHLEGAPADNSAKKP